MRNLEVRLEKLEQAIKPSTDDMLAVMLINFVSGGPIKAWKSSMDNPEFYIERLPGESEEDFAERASAQARAKHPPTPWGHILLYSENEKLPAVAAELASEQKLEPCPAKRAGTTETTAALRMARIKEIESQGPSRHWMS